MIRRPPRSTQSRSSAASDVYKRQGPRRPREPSGSRARGDLNARSRLGGSRCHGSVTGREESSVNAPQVRGGDAPVQAAQPAAAPVRRAFAVVLVVTVVVAFVSGVSPATLLLGAVLFG